MNHLLDENGRRSCSLIDQIHRLVQLPNETEPPQIVVIGKRSSGKSSVLQAIFNLPPQIGVILCTRFAIEINYRRSNHSCTFVRIVPDATEPYDQAKKQRLDDFKNRWSRFNIHDEERAQTMIQEARDVMGLQSGSGYSSDRLIIQIQGPTQHCLTLIDLPGFNNEGDSEMHKVESIVKKYLSGTRTIILAVVHSLNDNKDQAFYSLEQKYWDKSIGVITAPDMIDWGSKQGAFIKAGVILSPIQPTNRWHVVRNLSAEEIKNGLARDEIENEFFAGKVGSPEWQGMENVSCGITPLKQQLGKFLAKHIAADMPELYHKIDQKAKNVRYKLRGRNNRRIRMIRENSDLTAKILVLKERLDKYAQGDIDNLEIDPEGPTLRNQLKDANKSFVEFMVNKGHTWEIGDIDESDSFLNNPAIPLKLNTFNDREPYRVSLNVLLNYFTLSAEQDQHIWGTADSALIRKLFMQQSSKWVNLMKEYVEKVFSIVESKVKLLVSGLMSESIGSCLFRQIIQPHLKQQHEKVLEKLRELLKSFKSRHTTTLCQQYTTALCDKENRLCTGWKAIDISEGWDIRTQAGANIYNCTQLYYRVALNALMDNVQNLEIERVLFEGIEDTLTPESLSHVETTATVNLASETPEMYGLTALLKRRLHSLEQAQSLILNYKLQSYLDEGNLFLSPCRSLPATPPRPNIQVSDYSQVRTPQRESSKAFQDVGSNGDLLEVFESISISSQSTPSTISEVSTPQSSKVKLEMEQRENQAWRCNGDFNKDEDVFVNTGSALIVLSI